MNVIHSNEPWLEAVSADGGGDRGREKEIAYFRCLTPIVVESFGRKGRIDLFYYF